jgi:hypothetical protein
MQGTQFQSALEQLRGCIDPKNDDAVAKIFMDLELATVENGGWPVGFFDELERLLRDQNFLDLTNSWNLLYFINNNWEQLSEQQRERLRQILADAFDQYGDWMGAFVTSEILGEHYADEPTLATLANLSKTARLPARAAIPHALETLAKTTHHESLRGLAIRQLQELQKSDSEQVRQEALISLKKLGH